MIVRFSRAAQADIQNIYDYIASENPIAARSVVIAIERATVRLEQFPLSGRKGATESTRELVVSRLPYIVVYVATETDVEIVAVFHAAQDKPRAN
jgi:toxin ParE1/3/4